MGSQMIRQPDGRIAVFSSVVDDWILYDATDEEAIDYFAEQGRAEYERQARRVLADVDAGTGPRSPFRKTFEEAQEWRAEVHGSAPWPPGEGA